MRCQRISSLVLALSMLLEPTSGFAVSAQANVKIEQISPAAFGTWLMNSSAGSIRTSQDQGVQPQSYTFGLTDYGPTTLSVQPPAGMSARITIYRGGEKVAETDAQQYSFTLVANDNYRFVIQYALSKLGSLGVTSEPSGLKFRMKGSTGRTYAGKTPYTFNNIPVGRYAITLSPVAGCTSPATHSVVVESDSRNVEHITMATCDQSASGDTKDYSRVSKRTLREYAEQREFRRRGDRK